MSLFYAHKEAWAEVHLFFGAFVSSIFENAQISLKVLVLIPDQEIEPRSLQKFIMIIVKKLSKKSL